MWAIKNISEARTKATRATTTVILTAHHAHPIQKVKPKHPLSLILVYNYFVVCRIRMKEVKFLG